MPEVQRQEWSSVVWTYSWFLSGSCWGKGDATPYNRFPSGSSILCDHLPRVVRTARHWATECRVRCGLGCSEWATRWKWGREAVTWVELSSLARSDPVRKWETQCVADSRPALTVSLDLAFHRHVPSSFLWVTFQFLGSYPAAESSASGREQWRSC